MGPILIYLGGYVGTYKIAEMRPMFLFKYHSPDSPDWAQIGPPMILTGPSPYSPDESQIENPPRAQPGTHLGNQGSKQPRNAH